MASIPWISLVPATLRAACAASVAGAISFAAFFTIGNLAVGAYFIAAGRTNAHALDLLGFIVSGAIMFVVSLAFSFIITVPVSSIIAVCAFPFLRALQAAGPRAFGAVGFLVGVFLCFVWSAMWWNAGGNIYFGSWNSSLTLGGLFIVGGFAGCAGGLAFARHLPQQR
jgi:hypothetical protein